MMGHARIQSGALRPKIENTFPCEVIHIKKQNILQNLKLRYDITLTYFSCTKYYTGYVIHVHYIFVCCNASVGV